MSKFSSFKSIVELWPSRKELAAEIGADPRAVAKWCERDSVPADWWSSMLSSPVAKRARLSADLLTELAARERRA